MQNNQRLIIGGIVIVVVALLAGIFFLTYKNTPTKTTTTTKTIPTPTPLQGETIMATFTRFVPDTLTIKKGTVLDFANFSGAAIDIQSETQELSIGLLQDNDTSDFVKLEPGTYTYFNKLKPEEKGTIIVTN